MAMFEGLRVWLRCRRELYEIRVLSGQRSASSWPRVFAALWGVAPYWSAALLVLVASACISLYLSTTTPLTVGSIAVSLLSALLLVISPADDVLATLRHFRARLKANGVGTYADRSEIEEGFEAREQARSQPARQIVKLTNQWLIAVGIMIALLSEFLPRL